MENSITSSAPPSYRTLSSLRWLRYQHCYGGGCSASSRAKLPAVMRNVPEPQRIRDISSRRESEMERLRLAFFYCFWLDFFIFLFFAFWCFFSYVSFVVVCHIGSLLQYLLFFTLFFFPTAQHFISDDCLTTVFLCKRRM